MLNNTVLFLWPFVFALAHRDFFCPVQSWYFQAQVCVRVQPVETLSFASCSVSGPEGWQEVYRRGTSTRLRMDVSTGHTNWSWQNGGGSYQQIKQDKQKHADNKRREMKFRLFHRGGKCWQGCIHCQACGFMQVCLNCASFPVELENSNVRDWGAWSIFSPSLWWQQLRPAIKYSALKSEPQPILTTISGRCSWFGAETKDDKSDLSLGAFLQSECFEFFFQEKSSRPFSRTIGICKNFQTPIQINRMFVPAHQHIHCPMSLPVILCLGQVIRHKAAYAPFLCEAKATGGRGHSALLCLYVGRHSEKYKVYLRSRWV